MTKGKLYLRTADLIQDCAHINDLNKQIKVHKLLDEVKDDAPTWQQALQEAVKSSIPGLTTAEMYVALHRLWFKKWFGEPK